MTTIGEMRHRLVFQTPTRVVDSIGGYTETWATYKTLWGSIEPASKGERFFANQIQDIYSHKIRIRKTTGLTTKMRVSFDSRIFQIKGITADKERKDFMTVFADEGVGT